MIVVAALFYYPWKYGAGQQDINIVHAAMQPACKVKMIVNISHILHFTRHTPSYTHCRSAAMYADSIN